jgi:hypothetical protein
MHIHVRRCDYVIKQGKDTTQQRNSLFEKHTYI